MHLQGRVVLVTGAGRGLGRSIALEAARAGATVVGGSRTTADLDSLEADVDGRQSVPLAALGIRRPERSDATG